MDAVTDAGDYGEKSLRSVNFPDRYVRHRNLLAYVEVIDSKLAASDATFRIRDPLAPGAGEGCYSFEATNPKLRGWYLRHQNFRLKLSKATNDEVFKKDATFCLKQALASRASYEESHQASFESFNFPGYFIRHSDFELAIRQNDGSDVFKRDATFVVERPVRAPGSFGDDNNAVPAR